MAKSYPLYIKVGDKWVPVPAVPGPDGGYYIPSDAGGSIHFTGSKSGMPEVPDIPIPGGGSGSLQPLTFTGAVSAEYDGTAPVTVPIPAGGGISVEKLNPTLMTDDNYVIEQTKWDGPNFIKYGNIVQVQFSFKIYAPDNSQYHTLVAKLPGYAGGDRVVANALSRGGNGPARIQITENGNLNVAGGEIGPGGQPVLRIYDCCFCYVCKE